MRRHSRRGSSARSSSRSVIHLSPIVLVISRASSGLACTSQRRGVTPFVLLLKRSGQSAIEVGSQRRLDEPAVQRGHPVDGMAADDAQVRHAHLLQRTFLDKRHPSQAVLVARPDGGNMRQESAIDLVDDLQMPRHDALEQGDGPLLERLRQQRVVRVPNASPG